jgi:anti-sigma factor RsiW
MGDISPERPSDADLVAHLDGKLAADRLAWMQGWLARDAELRARLGLLESGGKRFKEAFGALLEAAPQQRLESMLKDVLAQARISQARPSAEIIKPSFRRGKLPGAGLGSRAWPRLGLIAAGLLLFLAGALMEAELPTLIAKFGLRTTEQAEDDWRQAAAQYVSLYTPETLSNIADDPAPRERELAALSKKLGLALPLASISLPGISLKRVQLLQYDGKPLGQIAYLDPHDGAVALCIYDGGSTDSQPASEQRAGLNVVHWSVRGRAFMLVGHLPASRLQEFASLLTRQMTL